MVAPTRFSANFYASSVGEAFRLPFLHKFVGRGNPSPTGIILRNHQTRRGRRPRLPVQNAMIFS